ncbi:MAG: hypothetical protein HGA62_08975 [Chlorobiaceae bacterium]|nr:hypothetical protein [Chlorobiaceae bacterium]
MSTPEIFNFRNTRHKLYWYKPIQPGDVSAIRYPLINVGKVVAEFISVRPTAKHLGLDVEEFFKGLICDLAEEHWGVKGVSLTNIGILLEPDLSLNVEKILMDLSREYAIIIVWPFKVENSRRLVWDDTAKVSLDFPEQTIHHLEL